MSFMLMMPRIAPERTAVNRSIHSLQKSFRFFERLTFFIRIKRKRIYMTRHLSGNGATRALPVSRLCYWTIPGASPAGTGTNAGANKERIELLAALRNRALADARRLNRELPKDM